MPRPVTTSPRWSRFGEGRLSHFAKAAARLSTSMPRLSLGSRYFSRNSTGSAFAAAASSSMKHSLAKVFCIRPGVRIQEGRSGVVASRRHTVLTLANLYGIAEFWKMLPGAMSSPAGMPASVAAMSGTLKLPAVCCGMKNSDSQAVTVPAPSTAARRSPSVGGYPEHCGKLLAQIVRCLRGRPGGQPAIFKLGDRAGRPDRAVRVDSEVVGGFQCLGARLAHRLGGVADTHRHLVLDDLSRAHLIPQFRCIGQRLRFRPRCLELLRRLDRAPLALCNDAEEIALAHDLDYPGNVLDRSLIDALERGPDRRRADDAPMQHAGHAEVLHVGETSRHFVRDVDARHRLAHELVVLGVLAGGGLGVIELERERLPSDELAVAHPFVAGTDHAVDDLELALLGAQALGRLLE